MLEKLLKYQTFFRYRYNIYYPLSHCASSMISRYNQSQTIKAMFLLMGGICCCGLAYGFFRYLPVFVAGQFGYTLGVSVAVASGLLGLAAAWFSGYRSWKSRGGLFGYHESGLYHDLGEETAGAQVVDFYAHRITGPAYLIGQIFMAGPQGILKSLTLLRSRIARSDALEKRLETTLATLQAANKWQGLNDYPEWRSEILYLAQMGLIDFSARNGNPRFKAR